MIIHYSAVLFYAINKKTKLWSLQMRNNVCDAAHDDKSSAYHSNTPLYRVYKKKLNKPEIALRLCKAPQCTKFFSEIGCLGTDNVV